jgi:pimeloyl-ACP methyl ester carboxylesterase
MQASYSAPSRLLTALEGRAIGEFVSMMATKPLLDRLPRGDGQPVLVLPGFSASDRSTQPLRALLGRLGYNAYEWGLGLNIGPTPQVVQGIVRLLDRISSSSNEPVTIIGWSLGGIYARELARLDPTAVKQVITLGSPIQMIATDRSASSPKWEAVQHLHDPSRDYDTRDSDRPPLRVPASSIYTRTDGVVHWKSCLIERGLTSENIEVHGSHCGLGFNPSVAYVLADRLILPAGRWRPFKPPIALRGLFPKPANLVAGKSRAA